MLYKDACKQTAEGMTFSKTLEKKFRERRTFGKSLQAGNYEPLYDDKLCVKLSWNTLESLNFSHEKIKKTLRWFPIPKGSYGTFQNS